MQEISRTIFTDGPHANDSFALLANDIGDISKIKAIATEIILNCVDPISGTQDLPSDGLVYGLIQSGKTSVINASIALAADNNFQCILVLTSDIDLLYGQTLERVRASLRGLRVLGKRDWDDPTSFARQVHQPPFVIVCSKNTTMLSSLHNAFRVAGAKGLSALIVDDEADQASLNTNESKPEKDPSAINREITQLRAFFGVNTYLQVTATPQSLFLQTPGTPYRPTFTILTEPGEGYVGGEAFFGPTSELLRFVPIEEIEAFQPGHQPIKSATGAAPDGLKQALYTFFIAATARNLSGRIDGAAFLCHVSMRQADHRFMVEMIDRLRSDILSAFAISSGAKYEKFEAELKRAYDDISITYPDIKPFDDVLKKLKFFLPAMNIKLVNAETDEEIALDAALNVFVGGNKLGRGVTIKNLLVSYYGRNPKKPNADTVLQHARMYGYRKKDIGLTRLFLPQRLADHFRYIHQMESALRDLIENNPGHTFEGVFISSPLQATRRNVLNPESIGMYVAGKSYNPCYPLRTNEADADTEWLDEKLKDIDSATYRLVTIDFLKELIMHTPIDERYGSELWKKDALVGALQELSHLHGEKAYIVPLRDRDLNQERRETQGLLSGKRDEAHLAPDDAPTLFMLRTNANQSGEHAAWWPQLRFKSGHYVLAFTLDPDEAA